MCVFVICGGYNKRQTEIIVYRYWIKDILFIIHKRITKSLKRYEERHREGEWERRRVSECEREEARERRRERGRVREKERERDRRRERGRVSGWKKQKLLEIKRNKKEKDKIDRANQIMLWYFVRVLAYVIAAFSRSHPALSPIPDHLVPVFGLTVQTAETERYPFPSESP